MTRSATITLPGDCAELSPNSRMNLGKRIRLIKKWRMNARLVWANEGFRSKVPVEISFTAYRWRKVRDAQNLESSACLKAAIDGLIDAGLVPDDNDEWVRIIWVNQITGAEYRYQPMLAVTVEER